jgi:NodT family efflux transporter outer membrane factor (OMF) lipoprotein
MGIDPSVRGEAAVASTPTSAPANAARWWEVFGDAALSSLVERATRQNLDLAAAAARLREARATRDAAAAGLSPSVDAGAAATRSRNRTGGTGNLFRAGFDAAWEIDAFGGIRRGVEAADAGTRSTIEDARDVQVTVAGEVATAYCELRGAQRELAIARKNQEAQRETLHVTTQRFDAGYVGGLDVANARANVAGTSSRIPALEATIRGSMYALGVLLGQEPGSLVDELRPEGAVPMPPTTVPVGVPSDLLRRRPDIRRAEEDVHAATARVGVATADLYPKFSLTGSLGVQSGSVEGLGSIANRYWSIGPSVNWPLLDGGRIRANIRVREALADETGVAYRKAVLGALREVEAALVNFQKEQERRLALEESVAANRRAVELANELYVGGKTDFLNVLNAQRSLFEAEDQLVQSATAISTDLIALYKALGGGWEDEPSP